MSEQPYVDPFAGGDSAPSLSFKDSPIGTAYTDTVTQLPQEMQARDFDTGKPDFWEDGNPKKTIVTGLEVNGEERSLWAPKPSAMFAAIKAAQQSAGASIAIGGTLTVQYYADKPNERNPRLNPAKQYAVTYTPPNPFADQQQPAQQVAQQQFVPPQQVAQPPFQPVAQPQVQQHLQAVPPTQQAAPAPQQVQGALAPTAYPQPSAEQVQLAINAGMDPAVIFPGYQPPA